jgi:hypothetical protein
MKQIEKMTNKELAEYCKEHNIHVNSKNISKPTKTEFLMAIEEHSAGPKVVDSIDDAIDEALIAESGQLDSVDDFLNVSDEAEQKKTAPKRKKTKAEIKKQQYAELMPLRHVIINSNDNNQTRIKNQVEYCTWGNGLIGHHTDRFIIGREWHVSEGALRNLLSKKISVPIQDEEGNTIKFEVMPAYVIQRLDDLTQEEIEVIAKRQIIRNNSIDNLV